MTDTPAPSGTPSQTSSQAPLVGVLMGSSSDWETMQHAVQMLQSFGVPHEARVVSAHRMPDELFAYAESARGRGLEAIIAGAGGAAHLPGIIIILQYNFISQMDLGLYFLFSCKIPKPFLLFFYIFSRLFSSLLRQYH